MTDASGTNDASEQPNRLDPITAITDAVTEVVIGAMTRYVDDRLDLVAREVQDQIIDFEQRVGDAMRQMADVMAQRIVLAVEQERAEGQIAQNYETWVLTEAARLNVGVPEFAKVLAAVKAAQVAEKKDG